MNLSQLGRGRSLEMIVPALPVIVSQSVIALIIKNFIFVARRDGICIEPSRISGSLLLSMKKKRNGFHENIIKENIPSNLSSSLHRGLAQPTFHPFRLSASRFSMLPPSTPFSRVAKQKRLSPHPLLCENQAERACNISRTRSHRSFVRTRWALVIVPRLYKVYRGPFGRQKSIRSFVDHG